MKELNKSEYALLKLLLKNPEGLSGYQIKYRMSNMACFHAVESNSKVYPILNKLKEHGFIADTQLKDCGKRKKYNWKITPKGLEHFTWWLKEPAKLNFSREDILLKITVGKHQSKAQLAEHLKDYIQQIQEAKTSIKKRLEETESFYDQSPHWPYVKMNLDFTQALLKAKLQWAKSTLANM